jgi:NADPH-dependent curcumin reductase CurA
LGVRKIHHSEELERNGMTITQREVHLINHPQALPQHDDFAIVETSVDDPADGQLLIRNDYMSVDPAMRPRLSNGQQALNTAMMGGAIGTVVASKHADFKEGDTVQNQQGFREYFLIS